MSTSNTVIVIGAGAAGMMAAGTAASLGKSVIVIEKNKILGKKLLITGKGRCNVTNSAEVEDLIQNVPVNGSFLYSAFYTFSNADVIDFFERMGVPLKNERGGRVFPDSDKSEDIVNALKRYMYQNNVVITHAEVTKILTNSDKVIGVKLKDGSELKCNSIIIATGGISYPTTGSTGDGYEFARQIGHEITPLSPSLVPIETKETWVKDAMGLSLKNVMVTVRDNLNKKVFSEFGEMLFTHFGVSGPVILSASSHIKDIGSKEYKLIIDLKPALTIEKLDHRIQRDFEKYSRKQFINALNDLLPQKLIPIIASLSQIPFEKPVNQITKSERLTLANTIKNLPLIIKSFRPIGEAIITSGGVSVNEINPGTMESKILEGVFFAGEIIDVDAYTGGYNLQIAFSTGYLAGYNA